MGIFYDGIVYGIGWELYNDDYTQLITRLEKQSKEKMTPEQIQEVQKEYNKLSDTEKDQCKYYVLTSCTTSYEINSNSYICTYSFSKERLELFFQNGYDNQIC